MNKQSIFKKQVGKAVDKNTEALIAQNIVILPELQNLIPPLATDEYELLENSILQEGCRESIIVWKQNEDNYAIIDGHNRHSICKKHNKPFGVRIIENLTDIDAIKNWMIDNQLGKRNVTEETKSYLRGLQYKREKQAHGGERKIEQEASGQDVHLKTHERLAEQHKVSPKTIQRDERYADMIDNLVGENKELKWKILNKEIQIPKATLEKIAKQMPESLPEIGKLAHKLNDFNTALKHFLPANRLENQENDIQTLVTLLQKSVKSKDKIEAEKIIHELNEKIQTW
jgi:hypothetical protein